MAYGVKYRVEFDDLHITTKVSWKVDIAFKDYAGDVTDLKGTGTPLVITRGEDTDDKMTPIIGSEVRVNVQIEDDSIDLSEFYAIDEEDIKVTIYKDDVSYWIGFCKPDFCEFPYSFFPFQFTINATDRIALLKSDLVDVSDAKTGTGFMNLIQLLTSKGLFNSEVSNKLNVISTLKYSDSKTFEDKTVRYESVMSDDGNAMNIYDVVRQIAISFGARVFYSNGKFWFQRIEDMQDETPTVYTFTGDGLTPTEAPLSIQKLLKGDISSADIMYDNNDTFIRIAAPYKQVKMDFDYKFRGYLKNFAWEFWDGTDFDNWTRNASAIIDRHGDGTLLDPYKLFMAPSAGTGILWQAVNEIPQNVGFTVKTKIKFYKTQRMAFRFFICNTAESGGDQSADSLKLLAWFQAGNNWGDAQDNLGSPENIIVQRSEDSNEVEFNITMPPFGSLHDSDGNDYPPDKKFTFLMYIIDPDGTVSEDVEYNGMEVEEILVSINTNGYTGETDTFRSTLTYSVNNDLKEALYIDSFANVANSVYNAGEITLGDLPLWKTSHINVNSRLQDMNIMSRLSIFKKPYQVMKGTFYSNILDFEYVIKQANVNNKLFIQLFDEYDVKRCQHKMTLAEIQPFEVTSALSFTNTKKYKTK